MGVYDELSDFTGGIIGISFMPVITAVAFSLALHFGHIVSFPSSDPRLGYQSGSDHRSTLSIIWSCLSTIFICVYTAMHHNVPKTRHNSALKALIDKVLWVILGIAVPELIVGLAAGEYADAQAISRRVRQDLVERSKYLLRGRRDSGSAAEPQDPGYDNTDSESWPLQTPQSSPQDRGSLLHAQNAWTPVHSFFLIMGGFEDRSGNRMKPGHFIWLVTHQTPEYDQVLAKLSDIQREIKDKSKADPLVKTLACLQITWFLVNIIARLVTKLPVSQLEWTACGYIVCALGTYVAWWNKPYSISERISLPVDATPNHKEEWESKAGPYRMAGLILGTLLFGAFHLAAWNSEYINSSGKILWRIGSLFVTIFPLVFMTISVLSDYISIPDWLGGSISVLGSVFYGISRLTLLCLIALSFWSLPAGAYLDVSWSSFLPSIH